MTFTPTDSTDYSSSTDTVSVTVSQAVPNVTWPTASTITYGQTLADSKLSGGTGDGSFTWTTPTTAPGAGSPSESVTFTPTDSTDYSSSTDTVSSVSQAVPNVTWPTAGAITYGQTLADSKLSGGTGDG